VLTNTLIKSLIDISNSYGKKILIDPKGSNFIKYKGAYLLTPNKKEASDATQINIQDEKTLMKAISSLKKDCDLDISLITLSEQGIAIFDDELRIHPTITREVFDVTGAGDTVLASLGYALACDVDIDEAVKFSNLAAGVVVSKVGSSTVTINEIIEYESSLNKSKSDKHIKTFEDISLLSKELKSRGKKIVFTNGCFDLLHAGHIKYLEASKSFGDILIVGLNSNRSVSNLKGENRPINSEVDRAYLLAALESVDYVVIFDEDTPYNLIKAINPYVLTKGGDYRGKKVIGDDLVKELKFIDFVSGKSSSNIIKKIQQSK
jgi:D-beta-D-heptose 7-phosphate kinase/D-beta-D-heptose 1-phosphate adenosyltransferase